MRAGYADGLFQNLSNAPDTSRTTAPVAMTSRSAITVPVPSPKYSFPTLRPPTMVAWPSTVNDLLCIRRFTRRKSVT